MCEREIGWLVNHNGHLSRRREKSRTELWASVSTHEKQAPPDPPPEAGYKTGRRFVADHGHRKAQANRKRYEEKWSADGKDRNRKYNEKKHDSHHPKNSSTCALIRTSCGFPEIAPVKVARRANGVGSFVVLSSLLPERGRSRGIGSTGKTRCAAREEGGSRKGRQECHLLKSQRREVLQLKIVTKSFAVQNADQSRKPLSKGLGGGAW
ncbi:hypothetical protein B0H14DRAFT_3706866 [Mycena olivaceomarginata]|nr:hypothetical protein B0H14DRAFT_3706866 [Mycena olivaceomarginata]